MSKNKRDPEQELRNRKRIEMAWGIIILSILLTLGILAWFEIMKTTILPFVQTVLAGELPKDEQDFLLAVVGATSLVMLLFVFVNNSERVKELEKIVEGEATNEEQD